MSRLLSIADYGVLALNEGATDLHFVPGPHSVAVFLRSNTKLRFVEEISHDNYSRLLNMAKFGCGIDVADARFPQEARLRVQIGPDEVEVRASIMATVHGETLSLRFSSFSYVGSLTELGLTEKQEQALIQLLNTGTGMFLVTGLTGSGKTTTFYNLLGLLSQAGSKAMTIEDPVERFLDKAVQVQASPQTGLDFKAAIRSALRHDIDVLGIGEIRDAETAKAATNAAFSVRLVIATMHSTGLGRAIKRLVSFGVPAVDAEALLLGMSFQKLVGLRNEKNEVRHTAVFSICPGPFKYEDHFINSLNSRTLDTLAKRVQELQSSGYTVFNRSNDPDGGDSCGNH